MAIVTWVWDDRTELNARLWGWQQDISCKAWGRCKTQASHKLQALLHRKAEEAIRAWKKQVKTLPGACRWVKAKVAPQWLLELKTHQTGNNCAGQTVTQAVGQAAGAQLLRKAWEPVFCGDPGYSPSIEAYMKRYESFLEPTQPERTLRALTEADLRSTVTSMASKAGGLDGWDSRALLRLPQQAWSRLLDLLRCVENGAPWPAALTHWKLVFIPKPNKGSDAGIPSALDTRPIAIGPVIYKPTLDCGGNK